MDGDPGALVTPRKSGPEVVGSNPTGPTKQPYAQIIGPNSRRSDPQGLDRSVENEM